MNLTIPLRAMRTQVPALTLPTMSKPSFESPHVQRSGDNLDVLNGLVVEETYIILGINRIEAALSKAEGSAHQELTAELEIFQANLVRNQDRLQASLRTFGNFGKQMYERACQQIGYNPKNIKPT